MKQDKQTNETRNKSKSEVGDSRQQIQLQPRKHYTITNWAVKFNKTLSRTRPTRGCKKTKLKTKQM